MKEVSVQPSGIVLQALFNISAICAARRLLDLFFRYGKSCPPGEGPWTAPVAAVEILPARVKDIRSLFSGDDMLPLLTMDVRRAVGFLRRKGFSFRCDIR